MHHFIFKQEFPISISAVLLLNAPVWLAMTDDARWLTPFPPRWVSLHVTYWNTLFKKNNRGLTQTRTRTHLNHAGSH